MNDAQYTAGISSELTKLTTSGLDILRSRYGDPHMDIASRYLPRDLKRIWNYCVYYSLMNPIVGPLIQKISTYIVTTPIYKTADSATRDKYRQVFERVLDIRNFVAGFNIDYNTYGIAYASLVYPFTKILICPHCNFVAPAAKAPVRIRNLEPYLDKCPGCKRTDVKMIARDVVRRNANFLRIIRWNPQNIQVVENSLTGECTYIFTPGVAFNNTLLLYPEVYAGTPQEVIDAIKNRKQLKFFNNQIYVAKRQGPSNTIYRGYGIPLMMPALKDLYLYQLARKAQETILYEHILPIRVAFPMQPESLAQRIPLDIVSEAIQEQLRGWRHDQARILVFPIPIAIQEFGGRGRALLMMPEMQSMAQIIANACMVPVEFLYGGLTWSGSSVSLRILDNFLLYNIERNNELLQFIADKVSQFLDYPRIDVSFKPFKMADDIQRSNFLAGLNARNLVSAKTLLQTLDLDYETELQNLKHEVKEAGFLLGEQQSAIALSQGKAQTIQARQAALSQLLQQTLLAKAQQQQQQQELSQASMPEQASPQTVDLEGVESPLNPAQLGLDIYDLAAYQARKIKNLPPADQHEALARLKQQFPDFAKRVLEALNQSEEEKSLPEMYPPRRENSPI